jgi:hypothetical protein
MLCGVAEPRALVVVGGWIASGKSTLARAAAEATGAELLVADDLCAQLAVEGAGLARWSGFSDTLYRDLLARAEARLAEGRAVVLDGILRSRAWRAAARALPRRHGAACLFVECRAPLALCRERLSRRGNPAG